MRIVDVSNRGWWKGVGHPPKQLYYEGEWREELWEKCAAVVGTRRITQYGIRAVEMLVPRLVDQGYTIVSGFMYGVDQRAHRVTMECGGKTVAVLGWGIEWSRLSDEEIKLFREIVDSGGLIISEWENQIPTLWTFPQRNRIVAAMCSDVYVIEGGMKSGSLITAELGFKFGKNVWAVPGPVTSRVSEGTNWLIAEGRAKMWMPNLPSFAKAAEGKRNNIASLLQNEELTLNELAIRLNRKVDELGAEVTILMLRGEVEERGGKYYLVRSK